MTTDIEMTKFSAEGTKHTSTQTGAGPCVAAHWGQGPWAYRVGARGASAPPPGSPRGGSPRGLPCDCARSPSRAAHWRPRSSQSALGGFQEPTPQAARRGCGLPPCRCVVWRACVPELAERALELPSWLPVACHCRPVIVFSAEAWWQYRSERLDEHRARGNDG
jgi:hypothetical protein